MTGRWAARLRALEQGPGDDACPAWGWRRGRRPVPGAIWCLPATMETAEICASRGRLLVCTAWLGKDAEAPCRPV